jgi:hypothetical protein
MTEQKRIVKKAKIKVNMLPTSSSSDVSVTVVASNAQETKDVKPRITCGCLIIGYGINPETEVRPWLSQWTEQLRRNHTVDLRYLTVPATTPIDVRELRASQSLLLCTPDVLFVWMRSCVNLKNVTAVDIVLWKDVDRSVPQQCHPSQEKDSSVIWGAARKLMIESRTRG